MNRDRLKQSLALLTTALKEAKRYPKDMVRHAGLAKSFETTFEYAWKDFKQQADAAGIEGYSPRDAIKAAAQLGLIADLELWNSMLNARNLSVHDYLGIGDSEYLRWGEALRQEIQRLLS